MSHKPMINIVTNQDNEFSTAHVGKRLVAVRWRIGDGPWVVVSPGAEPQRFESRQDAFGAFYSTACEALSDA